jgi:hypothetical protein
MRKIIILVIVLVVLAAIVVGLAYADQRLRGMIEQHAEAKIAQTLPQVEGVHVTIDGFPFTLGVLLRGEVEALHVKIDVARERGLEASELSLDVETIMLDKDALIDEQRLVVNEIGKATVQGFVSDAAVSTMVKREVVFEPGKARVEYAGKVIEAHASVKGRMVWLSSNLPQVPPLVFPLPSSDVLPCTPELELLEGTLRLSCSIDRLPPRLRDAMAQR